MLKEHWTYKKLGEVCTLITKGTTPTSLGFEFTEDGVAFIKIESLTDEGGVSPSMVAHISEECNNALKRSQLEEFDILYSIAGALGRVAVVPKSILPANTNQALAIIRLIDKNPTFIHFLKHFLQSKKMLETVMGLKVGVAQQNLSLAQIRELSIPIPTYDEQSRIVSELNLLQSIIDKQQAQLKELDKLAQAVFYDMFGDPVENEKGWDVIEMGELFEIGSSKRVFEAQWTESGVPFYRAREIVKLSKNEPIDSPIFISEELYQEYSKKYGVPSAGDMMVTAVGTLGVTYIVKASDKFYFKDGNTLWFKSKGLCETRFIKDEYSTDYVIRQIQGNANAAVVGTYTIMNAKKTKVVVPPISLQKKYVAIVENIDKQKAAISQSMAETQKLFDYTMDKYFG